MIIIPKTLFCLNAKTILNKWKVTAKKEKKNSLTQLQLVNIEEEKRKRGKNSNTSDYDLNLSPQSLYFCVNLAKNQLKAKFKKKWQKNKNTSVYANK